MPRISYPGVYIEEFGGVAAIQGVATLAVGALIGITAAIVAERLRQRCTRTE